MARKILFLGETKSFMVNALLNELTENGYDFDISDFTLRALMDINAFYKSCLVYLKVIDDTSLAALKYLGTIYDEKHIQIFLIGSKNDLEEAYFTLPKSKIAKSFVRPLNVAELAHELDKVYESQVEEMKMKKILIVDDDATMLRSMRNLLSTKYATYIVSSGADAIKFLDNIPVNLILLDYEMPEMSGPEVLEKLKSNAMTKSIPVMFLTAKQDSESVKTAAALKPEKYLLKSLPSDIILATVDTFLKNL